MFSKSERHGQSAPSGLARPSDDEAAERCGTPMKGPRNRSGKLDEVAPDATDNFRWLMVCVCFLRTQQGVWFMPVPLLVADLVWSPYLAVLVDCVAYRRMV